MEIESLVANSALIRAREGKEFLFGFRCEILSNINLGDVRKDLYKLNYDI